MERSWGEHQRMFKIVIQSRFGAAHGCHNLLTAEQLDKLPRLMALISYDNALYLDNEDD